jgi:uncharacterized membrane protein
MEMGEKNKAKLVMMMLFSALLGSGGQLFFKLAFSPGPFAILLAIGVALYLSSTVIYFYVLGRSHLSWTYGFTGLSYIFASLLASLVLGESIGILRWTGIGLIAIGTAMIGTS